MTSRPSARRPSASTAWPPNLRSRRLLLRAASPDDPRPAWLDEAETTLLGDGRSCPLFQAPSAGDSAYWLRPSGSAPEESLGACAARIADGDLVWTWLAVGAESRAMGYGGAAVPIVERAALRLGCDRGRVAVPKSNGIALYFWLRLGYRPDPAAAWPLPPLLDETVLDETALAESPAGAAGAGGTWMTRDLSARDRPARPRR